jgi:hypothetical protein
VLLRQTLGQTCFLSLKVVNCDILTISETRPFQKRVHPPGAAVTIFISLLQP